MNFETTVPIYVLIAGILSFVVATFNKENQKYDKNKNKYFKMFLLPYFNSCVVENNDVGLFYDLKTRDKNNQYIPEYVHYLRRMNRNEDLNKVLIADYLNFYPSKKKSINKSMDTIFNITDIIMYFISFIMILLLMTITAIIIPSFLSDLYGIINNTSDSSIIFGRISVPVFVFFIIVSMSLLGLYIFLIKYLQKNISKKDIYTYDKKFIDKLIKERKKRYNKLKKNNIYIEQKASEPIKETTEVKTVE